MKKRRQNENTRESKAEAIKEIHERVQQLPDTPPDRKSPNEFLSSFFSNVKQMFDNPTQAASHKNNPLLTTI